MKLFLLITLLITYVFACAQEPKVKNTDVKTYEYVIDESSTYEKSSEKIASEKYLKEKRYIDVAYKHFNRDEYAIAEIWARKVSSFEELYYHRYYILTLSSAFMKDKSKFKMYYRKLKDYASSDELREAEKKLIETGAIKKMSIAKK